MANVAYIADIKYDGTYVKTRVIDVLDYHDDPEFGRMAFVRTSPNHIELVRASHIVVEDMDRETFEKEYV